MTNTNTRPENFADILAKIRKCLELHARPGTPEEGQAALLQAERLMRKWSVTQDELGNLNSKRKCMSVVAYRHGRSMPEWISALATVTAERYRVVSYIFHPFKDRMRVTEVRFFGYREDAIAAAHAFQYGLNSGQYLWDRHSRFNREMGIKTKAEYRRSYCLGFVRGIEHAYEREETKHALVRQLPKDIEDAFKSTFNQDEDAGNAKPPENARYAAMGYKDGMANEKSKMTLKGD